MTILHSSGCRIESTKILGPGWIETHEVSTEKEMTLYLFAPTELAVYAHATHFSINFQVTEVSTDRIINHYWHGPIYWPNSWQNLWFSKTFPRARDAGVSTYVSAGLVSGDGEYRFRPYLQFYELGTPGVVPASRYTDHAVAEEHFFLCRGAV
jgi:hypothetical protein